ncbi:MAG: SpoIIE family protein phosphatase [Vicinamibacterales bacterium]
MAPLHLRIEPDEGLAYERAIDAEYAVVGRSPAADLPLSDALVSRQHARFVRRPDGWWVEDLGARNTTLVNDSEIGAPTRVRAGDVVRVGHTRLQVLDGAGPGIGTSSATETEAQSARLALLNEVHRALATPISSTALLDLILERCFDLLRPEQGVILLRTRTGELTLAASRCVSGDPSAVLVSRRVVDEVVGRGQSALVFDTAEDERFAGAESIEASGMRSVLAAPLVDAAGTLGLIALYSRVRVRRFSQEDLDLLESLASAAALRVRNVALAEEAATRRVLEHELSLAHDIQMAMLPREMPSAATVELAARLEPARSVGGDLYDIVVDGDRIWLIVADVAGKGVAAALFMAVARTLFRACVPGAPSVTDVAGRINRELCRDNEGSMFVTAIVACVDPGTGVVMLCDAGHNPPAVLRQGGTACPLAPPRGRAFGVDPDFHYQGVSLALNPGDLLVAYTDGLTEARSPSGVPFAWSGLERSLLRREGEPTAMVIDGLLSDVKAFTGDAAPEDDLALLGVRYLGDGRVRERKAP